MSLPGRASRVAFVAFLVGVAAVVLLATHASTVSAFGVAVPTTLALTTLAGLVFVPMAVSNYRAGDVRLAAGRGLFAVGLPLSQAGFDGAPLLGLLAVLAGVAVRRTGDSTDDDGDAGDDADEVDDGDAGDGDDADGS